MTASILSHCSGELTRFDIQVLKDYALEAPWEWRKLFESLIELAEAVGGREIDEVSAWAEKVEDLEEKVEAHREEKESLERLKLGSLVAVQKSRILLREMRTAVMNQAVNSGLSGKIGGLLDGFSDDFTETLDELEAAAKGEMTSVEEEEMEQKVTVEIAKAKAFPARKK